MIHTFITNLHVCEYYIQTIYNALHNCGSQGPYSIGTALYIVKAEQHFKYISVVFVSLFLLILNWHHEIAMSSRSSDFICKIASINIALAFC